MSINFDSVTGFITPGSRPLDPIIDEYSESSQYLAYQKVNDKVIRDCVINYLIPTIHKAAGKDIFIPEKTLVEVNRRTDQYRGICNEVRVSLVPASYNDVEYKDGVISGIKYSYDANTIDILRKENPIRLNEYMEKARLNPFILGYIPYMDNSSVLTYNNKNYAVTSTISIEDSISFIKEEKKLKIVNGDNSIEFVGGFNPKLSLFNGGMGVVSMLQGFVSRNYSTCGNLDSVDVCRDMLLSIRNFKYRNTSFSYSDVAFKAEADVGAVPYEELVENGVVDRFLGIGVESVLSEFKFSEKFDNGYFATDKIRRELNDLLSFDKLVGRTISRDIVRGNRSPRAESLLFKAGTKITKEIVNVLNANMIDTVYVKDIPNISGKYLANQSETQYFIVVSQPVNGVQCILSGTPITSDMVELIPELDGMDVADKNYPLPTNTPLTIKCRTKIDNKMLRLLEFLGYKKVWYLETAKNKKPKVAFFEEEYINNRHFLISDLMNGPLANDKNFLKYVDDIDTKFVNRINNGDYSNEDYVKDYDDADDFDAENSSSEISSGDPYVYVDLNGNVEDPMPEFTCHDIIALTSMYLKLITGEHYDIISDPDLSLRKRVNQYDEHFRKAFQFATNKLSRVKKKTIVNSVKNTLFDKVNPRCIEVLNSLFIKFGDDIFSRMRGPMKVLDSLSMTNPMSTISDLTKINVFVKDSNSISDRSRRLTLLHYGVLCPFETPQSSRLGVVNNSAIGGYIEDGVLSCDYFRLVHKNGKNYVDLKNKVRLSVNDRCSYRIASISDVCIADIPTNGLNECFPVTPEILAIIPSTETLENVTVGTIELDYVDFITISSDANISWVCSTVPYAGFDDATRVQFGLSMAKAVRPLIEPEVPDVCTIGYKNIIRRSRLYYVFSDVDGVVGEVGKTKITIISKDNDGNRVTSYYEYQLETITSESVVYCTPVVVKGNKVKKGDALVISNFVKDDTMAVGRNILVGYMTDGYNYEDGQPMSTQTSIKLTSIGVHTDKKSYQEKSKDGGLKSNDVISDVNFFDYLDKGDTICRYSYKIGGRDGSYQKDNFIESKNCRGFLLKISKKKEFDSTEVQATSVTFDTTEKSDKLCNRHGNKGVVCKKYGNKDMPYLTNGIPLGLILNPNGIISRMNNGQLMEAMTGLSCHVLGVKVLCGSYITLSKEDIGSLLEYTVAMMNSDDDKDLDEIYKVFSVGGNSYGVVNKFPFLKDNNFTIPRELHDYVVNRIDLVRVWRGAFNEKGKAVIINPKSGKRLPKPVQIGFNYIYKLKQVGIEKIHARGGFLDYPYLESTQSPTKGSASEGGQKTGSMEADAIATYGATHVLQEIYNDKSSNYIKRNNLTVSKALGEDSKLMLDDNRSARGTFEMVVEYYKALGIKVEVDEIDTEYSERKLFYDKSVILDAMKGYDSANYDLNKEISEMFRKTEGLTPIDELREKSKTKLDDIDDDDDSFYI